MEHYSCFFIYLQRKSNSLSGGEGVSDDSSGGPVERLRAWVEGYEAAVTNHYSPELRARVHAARINGVSPDLRASTQGAVLGHRCRVASNPRPLLDVFDSKVSISPMSKTMNHINCTKPSPSVFCVGKLLRS